MWTLALTLLLSLACRTKDDPVDSAGLDADGDGFTEEQGDCDDSDAAVNPDAEEICDAVDNDCDGDVDGGLTSTWWADADSDGFGDAGSPLELCSALEGYVQDDTDCDDGEASVNPDAAELCNSLDDDCDGEVDEAGEQPWYADADGDGYGDPGVSTDTCDPEGAWVQDDTDCDDEDPAVNPGAEDICNLADDDCDGEVDEDPEFTWYMDNDGDGHGSTITVEACTRPEGTSPRSDDCDDAEPEVHPGATEWCNGVDDDCDGTLDNDDAADAPTWYTDGDGDGYGDPASGSSACTQPSGRVDNGEDCADGDADINPDADEVCDGVDNDCDGTADNDDAIDASTWYVDSDQDGYGDPDTTTTACSQPANATTDYSDCNDGDAAINPAATEVCVDGVDDDCDGTADQDCPIEHCGTLSSDETWSASDTHLVTCDVYVQGSSRPELVVEDGAEVYFESGAGLLVGWSSYGSLQVEGSSSGVLFTSAESSPAVGDWDGVTIGYYDEGSALEGLTLEYGGDNGTAGLYLYYSDAEIIGSTLQYNANYGLYATASEPLIQDTSVLDNEDTGIYITTSGGLDSSGATPTFTGNTLSGNGGHPMALPADFLGELDASSSFSGNTTDTVVGLGDIVSQDATWQLLDVPYELTGDVHVYGSGQPELVIEDGVEVRFGTNVDLLVGWSGVGSLVVEGTSTGVSFTSAESSPAQGDWSGVTIGFYDQGSDLEGLDIGYGGDNGYGCLRLYYVDMEVRDSGFHDCENHGVHVTGTGEVLFSGSSFEDNEDNGLYLDSASALDDSGSTATFTDNTLSGNGAYPITLAANELAMLDASSSFSGNTHDYVYVWADTVTEDGTWQDLDVPVFVAGDVYIQGSTAPAIEIEDGASFVFDTNAGLLVGSSGMGSLTVSGSSSGVSFSSAQSSPAAGDWDGLTFGYYAQGTQQLSGFTVEYGGDNSVGGLYLYYADVDATDCSITDNDNDGVYVAAGTLNMTDCVVSDNTDNGLQFSTVGELEEGNTFTGNTVTGNGEYPVLLTGGNLGGLSDGSSYTGNGSDYIYVRADTVTADAVWQALDVDYLVGGDLYVAGSTAPHVQIEDGATFYMDGSALNVGYTGYGSLEVLGSTTGVTFTSAESSPAAGDWDGLYFGYYCTANKVDLDGLTVSYGGDNGFGNIRWYYCAGSIDNATITDSSTYGMYFYGTQPTVGTVTYSNNASGNTN